MLFEFARVFIVVLIASVTRGVSTRCADRVTNHKKPTGVSHGVVIFALCFFSYALYPEIWYPSY